MRKKQSVFLTVLMYLLGTGMFYYNLGGLQAGPVNIMTKLYRFFLFSGKAGNRADGAGSGRRDRSGAALLPACSLFDGDLDLAQFACFLYDKRLFFFRLSDFGFDHIHRLSGHIGKTGNLCATGLNGNGKCIDGLF